METRPDKNSIPSLVAHLFSRAAYNDETALVLLTKQGKELKWTWEEYGLRTLEAVESLKKLGIRQGDIVALFILNLPESFFALSGLLAIGAVPVPISVDLLREKDLTTVKIILADCQPKLILANSCLSSYLNEEEFKYVKIDELVDFFSNCEDNWVDQNTLFIEALTKVSKTVNSFSPLVMPYTSGTTGNPKGVVLTNLNVHDRVQAIGEALGVDDTDKVISYLPLSHISELVATYFGQLMYGYTIYFTEHIYALPADRPSLAKAFPGVIKKIRPTIFLAVPKVWMNMRKGIEEKLNKFPAWLQPKQASMLGRFMAKLIIQKIGLDKAWSFISAGSNIPEGELNFFRNILGIHIDDVYGQTEVAGPITLNGETLGSYIEIKKGEENEILVVGDCVMDGYYQNAKGTLEVVTVDDDKQSVYHTGDSGEWFYDRAGEPEQVFWNGRIRDGFKLAQGEFITAAKIEQLESKIKKLEHVDEVIICGEGKPYLVALVFTSLPQTLAPITYNHLETNLSYQLSQLGDGLYRIGKSQLLDVAQLEITPTLKVKRRAVIAKLKPLIDSL